MLKITVPASHLFNEETDEFITVKETHLQLEHSLVSLSKWEAKWKKPYINKNNNSREEAIDYIRCMTITQNVDPYVYECLTEENIKEINDYINEPMTATWFNNRDNEGPSREIVTAEIIYYWMISFGIPFECQKWHLNRLLTLIRVCNLKSQKPKKMSRRETLEYNRALNNARKAKMHTKG